MTQQIQVGKSASVQKQTAKALRTIFIFAGITALAAVASMSIGIF